jgi:hypothetical protein
MPALVRSPTAVPWIFPRRMRVTEAVLEGYCENRNAIDTRRPKLI